MIGGKCLHVFIKEKFFWERTEQGCRLAALRHVGRGVDSEVVWNNCKNWCFADIRDDWCQLGIWRAGVIHLVDVTTSHSEKGTKWGKLTDSNGNHQTVSWFVVRIYEGTTRKWLSGCCKKKSWIQEKIPSVSIRKRDFTRYIDSIFQNLF